MTSPVQPQDPPRPIVLFHSYAFPFLSFSVWPLTTSELVAPSKRTSLSGYVWLNSDSAPYELYDSREDTYSVPQFP